jgi:nucleotide-binding universal stress UspA family protein
VTPTVRQVLYATDLSPASRPAWERAQQLGTLFDAEVLVLHVLSPVTVPLTNPLPGSVVEELVQVAEVHARQELETLLGGTRRAGVKARMRLDPGRAAPRILEIARETGADLVVMGTHSRTGLGRVLLGSVADRVVRQAPCPVVTVPPQTGAPPGSARLARICYATDFSPSARAAWPWAVALAEAAHAMLDLVHVTALPVPDAGSPPEATEHMAQLIHDAGYAEADRFLREGPLPRERVEVVIRRGLVDEQILECARSRNADLIVMGTHGSSGLVRWMLGSVAHHVVQALPRPAVLTVGPRSLEREPPHAA